ncbi:MAG TPA: hypothetical protein VN653_00320 [Anaerolineales bacterium]|nr:hypothetical protein [Anaerolineales bacterium]
MNIKRRLPVIGLTVLSVIVLIGAILTVWMLSADAKTDAERVRSSFTLGIPFGLLMIISAWLGGGLDHLLMRIEKGSTRKLAALAVYLLVPPAFYIGLPALLIVTISAIFYVPKGWQELPAPPSRPLEVAAAGQSSFYILADTGKYYSCRVGTPENCWQSAQQPDERIIPNNAGVLAEYSRPPSTDAPGEVASLLSVEYKETGSKIHMYYAVLTDGSAWYLEENTGGSEAGAAFRTFMKSAALPAVAGFLFIYLGAGVSAYSRRYVNQVPVKK